MKDPHVLLEGTLLKPSMVTPGKAWVGKVTPPYEDGYKATWKREFKLP